MKSLRLLMVVPVAVLLALSTVPDPAVAQSTAPSSRILKIPSGALGETRLVHVHLPEGYAIARQRYPVVVLLDGQVRAFNDITLASVAYDLTGEQHPIAMRPHIVVAVEQGDRADDLVRRQDAFLRFLTDELLPRIDKDYRTVPFRTLIGHSLGGRFALGALCRAPRDFPAVIAISPSLTDSLASAVVRCVREDSASTHRFLAVSAGTREPRALANVERLVAVLRDSIPPHWHIARIDAPGLDHTGAPLITIPMGLRFIFSDSAWQLPAAIDDSLSRRLGDADRLLARGIAARDRAFGLPRGASLDAVATEYARVVRAWLWHRNGERAVASARQLVERHPDTMLSHTLLIDALDAAGDQAGARKAIESALTWSNRVPWFDETQKARFQTQMRQALTERIPR